MENNTYRFKSDELESDTPILLTVYLKSWPKIVFFLTIGTLLLLTQNIGLIIMGIIFIAMCAANIIIVKNRKVLLIRDNDLVVYDNMDSSYCYKVSYDDIAVYNMETVQSRSFFTVTTNSGEVIEAPTSDSRIIKTLRNRIPEKEKFERWKKEVADRKKARSL